MPKYYIQSGQIKFVVMAADAEGAALWAMHRIIDDMVQRYEQEQIPRMVEPDVSEFTGESPAADFEVAMFEPMMDALARFDSEILCSQRGFGNDDAGTLDTNATFLQWRQLMRAADYLFDRLDG